MGVLLPSTTGALISSAIGMAMSLIPYKKNLYDLSTQNTTVTLFAIFDEGPATEIPLIQQFADDKEAISIQPCEINEVSSSYNGLAIVVKKVPKIRITLSLIPHGENDIAVAELANRITYDRSKNTSERCHISLTITQPRIDEQAAAFQLIGVGGATQKDATVRFSNGTIVSANAGGKKHGAETSALNSGRFEASQYTFEFLTCEPVM